MAGGGPVDDPSLKGMAKWFNGETVKGRANVARATYAVMGVAILYFWLKPSKK